MWEFLLPLQLGFLQRWDSAALGGVPLPVDILAVLTREICANAGFVNDLRDWLQACWMANGRMWVFNQVDLVYGLVIGESAIRLIYAALVSTHVTVPPASRDQSHDAIARITSRYGRVG